MEVYNVTAVNLFTDESLPVTFSVWDDEEVDISCLKVESSFCSLTASGEHLFEVFKILRASYFKMAGGYYAMARLSMLMHPQ